MFISVNLTNFLKIQIGALVLLKFGPPPKSNRKSTD